LIVGIHTDQEITKFKGPPVMNQEERYAAVAACKWVDEIVCGVPYVTYLSCLEKYNVDFCAHGEDVSTDEYGRDSYAQVKAAGKFRYVKRSEGVSTTELVGRMILKSKQHLSATLNADPNKQYVDPVPSPTTQSEAMKVFSRVSSFLPSTRNICDFSQTGTSLIPKPTTNNNTNNTDSSNSSSSNSDGLTPISTPSSGRVYIDGAFDLFHVGHIEALRLARSYGSYLIVGVHNDATVNSVKGANLPIMNLYERVLTVLSCRYVDEVIIGAPWCPSEEQITQLRISVIVRGSCSDYPLDAPEPHSTAKKMNIYKNFNSLYPDMTTSSIVRRILDNQIQYEERNKKKATGLLAILQQQKEQWEQKFSQQAKTTIQLQNLHDNGNTNNNTNNK